MKTCQILATSSGVKKTVDILSKSDKHLRVAIQGTTITINLSRSDIRRPYVGYMNGLEFTSTGI